MDALRERLSRLPIWQGPVTLEPLTGGLTNISYVASDRSGKYVVRCGDDIPVHHVFRDRERAASRAAFEAGLSPEVVHEAPGITVLRFIESRTFVEEDLRRDAARVVALLKTCHREVGRRLHGAANVFWVFHVIRDYVRAIDGDAKYLVLADRLEAAQVPLPIVFGHNDLLPGNLLDDGQRLWLIDWEYGGFGTAMFDLANLSSNGAFGAADDAALLALYFDGKADDPLRASFVAMKAASALREALWAMVSDVHLRLPGIDYARHARTYLARLDALVGELPR
ncbi:MAG: phosphotransferase family protein [Proteobacteria bacterium]|nr:phosphotransferase family protein [Pseudomonadota bacterium]